ncbi:MAG: hypothetical protein E7292_10435 [Lachnospiraceae bacterium]|nr:hypothetical protein [Lachnospiraceae bacterium]
MREYYIIETESTSSGSNEDPIAVIGGIILIGVILTLIAGKTGLVISLVVLALFVGYLLRDFIKIAILIKIGMYGYEIGGWIGAIVAFIIAAGIMESILEKV